jgi:copper chaperone NosL
MTIWLNHIGGDLSSINLLNHYIGMKHITPAAIPELSILPKALLGLMALGIVAAAVNRAWALVTWIGALIVAGLGGMADFYRWGYDYGHNLNPDAPIKIPGMSYQPPLLGHKQILNIDAYSYPSFGTVAILVAVGLAILALLWPRIQLRWRGPSSARGASSRAASLLFVFALAGWSASGCISQAEPIHVGQEHCGTCKMTIADERFGGEIITQKGKIYKFDSLECLADYYQKNQAIVRSVYVMDFLARGKLVAAERAFFLKSERLEGPMGHGAAASVDRSGLEQLQKKLSGEVLVWKSELKSLLSSS